MNDPYAEAERLVDADPDHGRLADLLVAQAQVFATLAVADRLADLAVMLRDTRPPMAPPELCGASALVTVDGPRIFCRLPAGHEGFRMHSTPDGTSWPVTPMPNPGKPARP